MCGYLEYVCLIKLIFFGKDFKLPTKLMPVEEHAPLLLIKKAQI